MLDADPCPDTDVQQLQKKLACVKREVEKQELQISTKIKSLCTEANTKNVLVAESRRTFTTTKTESEALRVKVNLSSNGALR